MRASVLIIQHSQPPFWKLFVRELVQRPVCLVLEWRIFVRTAVCPEYIHFNTDIWSINIVVRVKHSVMSYVLQSEYKWNVMRLTVSTIHLGKRVRFKMWEVHKWHSVCWYLLKRVLFLPKLTVLMCCRLKRVPKLLRIQWLLLLLHKPMFSSFNSYDKEHVHIILSLSYLITSILVRESVYAWIFQWFK